MCNEKWLQAASQVLRFVFDAAVRELLEKGRKKRLNIFFVGPSNCRKSFLLKLFEQVFTCFTNPAK